VPKTDDRVMAPQLPQPLLVGWWKILAVWFQTLMKWVKLYWQWEAIRENQHLTHRIDQLVVEAIHYISQTPMFKSVVVVVVSICCVVHCSLLVTYLKLCNHSNTVDHASCPPCCLCSSCHAFNISIHTSYTVYWLYGVSLVCHFQHFSLPSLTLLPVIWL